METLRHDVRYALRLLWKDRTFAVTVIATLAVCIAANTAIFAVVRSVLLRPLPYPQADRLVFLYDAFPNAGVERAGTSVPNYLDRSREVRALEAAALYQFTAPTLGEGTSIEGGDGMVVTPSFFRVLGVAPHRGRTFTEPEGTPGSDHVVILSYGYWKRAFAGQDSAIGREVRVNGELRTVVGVLPEGFAFINPDVVIWQPTAFSAEDMSEEARHSQNHESIGRLAPGATVEQAQQQIDALNQRILEKAGRMKPLLVNAGYHSRVTRLDADLVRQVRRTLQLLWGGALFVLLIAAANITNLVLVRATGRAKELATRHALGAGRGRMARQLLTETLVLTLIAGLLGLALGTWSLGWVSSSGLTDLPRGHEIRLDPWVVTFTIGLACLGGMAISVVPLAQLAGLDLTLAMREDGRTGTASKRTGVVRRSLVAVQIAVAFVLLIGAGLLFTSFQRLLAVDPGFRADHVLTGSVNLPFASYGSNDAKRRAFVDRALAGIRALPGVTGAAVTSDLPFGPGGSSTVIVPEGQAMTPVESVVSPNVLRVTPGYFETLGVKLVDGRWFDDRDRDGAPRTIVLDARLAKHFWPSGGAVGRRVFQPDSPEQLHSPGPNVKWIEVIGVVAAVKQRALVDNEDARVGAFYYPYAQSPTSNISFVVKTTRDAMQSVNSVRRVITGLDSQLLFGDVEALPTRVERSLQPRRTPMLLALAFGAVALLLASIGIYGVLAYQVSQRTREIGIRMTLGGEPASILRLVLREGAVLVAIGLGTGIAGAVALRQVIASQLYGVGALDPLVLGTVALVLSMAAFVACLAPARRASRVNPVVALARR